MCFDESSKTFVFIHSNNVPMYIHILISRYSSDLAYVSKGHHFKKCYMTQWVKIPKIEIGLSPFPKNLDLFWPAFPKLHFFVDQRGAI